MAKKIALVDDEKNILLVEKALLQSKGYEVIAINGSIVADEVIKEHMPDLVLMDLIMPGRNGVELAYSIKSDAATKDIKIIAVTGEPILNEQNMHNFDDMILKPFKSAELLEKITAQLG